MIEIIKISLIAYMIYLLGDPEEIFGWYQRLIKDLPMWLWKPLGGCYRCFTGQVCLWYYLIAHFKDYSLVDHGVFIAGGIALSMIYNLIIVLINHLTDKYDTTKT